MDEEMVLDGTQEEVVDLEEATEFEETEEVEADLSEAEEEAEEEEAEEEEADAEPEKETQKAKPKQTPEENARWAQLRREKEAARQKTSTDLDTVLKPFGVRTVAELADIEDVELSKAELAEAKRKALDTGTDEELWIEMEKAKKQRLLTQAQLKAQKLEQEAKKAAQEAYNHDVEEFSAKHPTVDINKLTKDPTFKIISKGRLGVDALVDIYEDMLTVTGQKAKAYAQKVEAKAERSTGSASTGAVKLNSADMAALNSYNKDFPDYKMTASEFMKYKRR